MSETKNDMTNPVQRLVMCFAVTDQQAVIPLKETSRKTYPEDGLVMITTEIVGDVEYKNHCEAHHKAYFKEMWLTREGEPDKHGVFMTLEEAKNWAAKSLRCEIDSKRNELFRLEQKLAKLDT